MTKYEGGYLINKVPFIRSRFNQHTSQVDDAISEETLLGLNRVQATPMRINQNILSVMWEAWFAGENIGGIPSPDPIPLPEKLPDAVWDEMTPSERMEYKARISVIHSRNASEAGKRESLLRKLEIAESVRDEEAIYFPHFLDFRGRLYPIPQDLNPQSDDVGKSLLMFAEGKSLGAWGDWWLAIALANAYGQDKLPLADRVAWTNEHSDLIVDSADNPLSGRRFWCAEDAQGEPVADSPWCFLALCFEWREYKERGLDAINRVPISIDGSCNGLQHLAALGRDPVGAKAVNMTAAKERSDLYTEVAEVVKQMVADDASQGNEAAQNWLGHVGRKTVKRAVMTTPYGVTDRGIRDQLVQDRRTAALEGSDLSNANYMRDKIRDAMTITVKSAKDIMGYLQDVAGCLADLGIPFRWTTPTGTVIQQGYYNLAVKDVRTLYGAIDYHVESKDMGLSKTKQRNSAAPNFIHSFDAAHLIKTVNLAWDNGVRNFFMIHDSYGTHACDVDVLRDALRESFLEIYQTDWLLRLEEEVKEYAPEVSLPPRPELGTFDVKEVRKAEYFFS